MTKKLIFSIPIFLILAAGALYAFANYKVKTVVDTRMAELVENGDYQALEYDTVALEFNGDIVMHNLHVIDINGNDYILVDIRIADYDYFKPVPAHMKLTSSGIQFPGALPAFGNSPGNALNNYLATIITDDTLPLEIDYQYDYYPDEDSLLQNSFRLVLPNAFNFSSQWQMKNVSIESLNQNPSGSAANSSGFSTMIRNADIPNASIALQDLGIVDAMLNIQGDALGMSSDEYRQQLMLQLQTAALFIPQQLQAIAQDFLGSVTLFLEGEHTFQLTVAPEYGGNVQQLQGEIMGAFYIGNFSRITELLNLNIETQPSN